MKKLQLVNHITLTPAHRSEIIEGSGVSEAIASLNFWTVTDPAEADKLLNRNSKKRWQHSDCLVPAWAVAGVDPKSGERWLQGVQLKPGTPIDIDGKPQKYLTASGAETQPLFLDTGVADYWQAILADRMIPIFITEGAKKSGCLLSLGHAAISLPGVWNGQLKGKLKPLLSQFCGLGRKVYLCFDSDQVSKPNVQQALDRLGTLLGAEECVVRVVVWDDQYKGVDDLCVLAGTDAVRDAIASALTFEEWRDSCEGEPKPVKKTAGDTLLEIARTATYFHTADKIAHADIWIDGNRHTYPVRSKGFRLWLSGEYFNRSGKGIGSQTLQDTLGTLEAIAVFQGETREVHLRVAEHQGKIYLDLGTPDWKAVEIGSDGWRLVGDYPVRFWRPESLLPLPYPVEGGSLNELRELLNVDGTAWTLIVTFLLFSFCPGKKYPVLVLSACRGSGKTTAAEILKGIIDPGKAGLIKLQSDVHRLAVAAQKRWVMAYDNISHISADESDNLCCLSTGFGYSTRTLNTTDEETCFEAKRPQIITAIDAIVTRDDLADRTLMVRLPEIPEDKRLLDTELNHKLETLKPGILGALLTALSQTLAELPNTRPRNLPRLADYARFAIAAEKAIGLKPGEFRETFDLCREESRQVVIEASPIGEAIIRLVEREKYWNGTAVQLLAVLDSDTSESVKRLKGWPKAANSLRAKLNRLAPDLPSIGVQVSSKIVRGIVYISLEKKKILSPPSPPYNPESSNSNKKAGGDRGGDGGDLVSQGGDPLFSEQGGDPSEGGDRGGDKKNGIATLKSLSTKGFQSEGGDGGDLFSNFSEEAPYLEEF
jgi:hypothetical protein